MKRFLYAVAAIALFAAVGVAEDQPATTGPTPMAPPVITSAAPVTQYAPSAPARRGLFGRLRNRSTSYSVPVSGPVMTTPTGATPMPPVAPPQAMPGAKPTVAMPMSGMVVQASGNLPPGTYTTTDGTVVQVGGTQMAAPMTTTATTTTSRGLFSRLRNR